MRVVLDTNVIVSGLLSPFSPSGKIVRAVSAGTLKLCYDARIISEYQSVLTRDKFGFDRAHVEDLLEQIKACGEVATSRPLAKRLPDQDDEVFLEVALGGEAEYLVTGNLRHYPSEKRQSAKVVSPAEFLEILRREKI